MAAHLIFPTTDEWRILREIGLHATEGCIIVSPNVVSKLIINEHAEFSDGVAGMLVDYDFGGEPDVMIDWVYDEDSYAYNIVRRALGLSEEEDEHEPT